jgi:hypothetical protein
MDHHPRRPQALRQVHIGLQVTVRSLAKERRHLGNVHRRECVQAEGHVLRLAQLTDAGAARIIEVLHGVGCDVGLQIDEVDAALVSPADRLLCGKRTADIDADAVLESHGSQS